MSKKPLNSVNFSRRLLAGSTTIYWIGKKLSIIPTFFVRRWNSFETLRSLEEFPKLLKWLLKLKGVSRYFLSFMSKTFRKGKTKNLCDTPRCIYQWTLENWKAKTVFFEVDHSARKTTRFDLGLGLTNTNGITSWSSNTQQRQQTSIYSSAFDFLDIPLRNHTTILQKSWKIIQETRESYQEIQESRRPTKKSRDNFPNFVKIFSMQSWFSRNFSCFSRIIQDLSGLILKVLNLQNFFLYISLEANVFRYIVLFTETYTGFNMILWRICESI